MTLQNKLSELRRQFEAKAPSETLTLMHRATDELRKSGIMERVLKVGEHVPTFTLPDEEGRRVSTFELLKKGPVVITFYRGLW